MKRFDILERDSFTCLYCGFSVIDDDDNDLEVDHVIPIALGGKCVASNVATACWNCNRGKADRSLKEAERILAVVSDRNREYEVDPKEQYFPKRKNTKRPISDKQKWRNKILLRSLNRYKELGINTTIRQE